MMKWDREAPRTILIVLANYFINVYFTILVSFQKLIFNYLVPYMVLILQMIGYHSYANQMSA